MPNQRKIAEALGIHQSTVSLALRNSPQISEELRKEICETAEQMGYRPNPAVNAVMCRIRAGKKMSDKGSVALLIEARSQEDWYRIPFYRDFHQGVIKRGLELGYRIESFFLQAPNMDDAKIDRILTARGISGIIMAPPYHGNRSRKLQWDRYSAIGVGFGWEDQELNRVVADTLYNFTVAFTEVRKAGYHRIGVMLHTTLIHGTRSGVQWFTAYLDCQNSIPEDDRIPVFAINSPNPRETPDKKTAQTIMDDFRQWFLKWRPDSILMVSQEEVKLLKAMNLKVPDDVGVACLSLQGNDSYYAGIYDKSEVIGATAVELISSQLAHNELGLPAHRKTTMIEGIWKSGPTIQDKNAGRVTGQNYG